MRESLACAVWREARVDCVWVWAARSVARRALGSGAEWGILSVVEIVVVDFVLDARTWCWQMCCSRLRWCGEGVGLVAFIQEG